MNVSLQMSFTALQTFIHFWNDRFTRSLFGYFFPMEARFVLSPYCSELFFRTRELNLGVHQVSRWWLNMVLVSY